MATRSGGGPQEGSSAVSDPSGSPGEVRGRTTAARKSKKAVSETGIRPERATELTV